MEMKESFEEGTLFKKSQLVIEEVYISRSHDMVIITLKVDEESFDEYLENFNRMVDSFEPLD